MKTVKLSTVLTHRAEKIVINDTTTYKLVRIRLHRKGVTLRHEKRGAEIRTKTQQLCKQGDFIVAEMDAKVGGYGFIPESLDGAIVSSHYYLYENDEEQLLSAFLNVICQAGILQDQIVAKGSTNYASVRAHTVLDWTIPLPSLEDQTRIVRRFDEAEDTYKQLTSESTHQQSLLDKLKQAILQDAIQGKLTADWRAANPGVEPASELLQRIQAEKARLIAEKIIRKEKNLPEITPEEIPFEIPDGWEWCKLSNVYPSTSGGTPARTNPAYWGGTIPWLKSGEMTDSLITEQPEEMITDTGLENSSATLFPEGTLLIAMYGATAGKLGILTYPSTTNQAVCGMFTHDMVETRYIFFYLLSRRALMSEESWGNSQPNISQGYLRNCPISLPPLAEQAAIVERVETLMATCRELETEIKHSQTNAADLLQAVLKEAFAPASS